MRKRVVYRDEDGREWPGWFDEVDATLAYEEKKYCKRVWLTDSGGKAHYAVEEYRGYSGGEAEFSRIPYSELAVLLVEEPEYATEEGKAWLEGQALETL